MEHQRFEGERTLMRIHIGESDRWHGKPLYEAIVRLLRREKFSGATVLRGVGGYGSSSIYHTDKILRLSQDLPIVVEFTERIEKILSQLDEMIGGGLVTLEKVRVILYRSNKPEKQPQPHRKHTSTLVLRRCARHGRLSEQKAKKGPTLTLGLDFCPGRRLGLGELYGGIHAGAGTSHSHDARHRAGRAGRAGGASPNG
jgi:hypothetical protein